MEIQSHPASAPFTLSRYDEILKAAIDAEYRFCFFRDFVSAHDDAKLCVLRHDCDNDMVAARRMAEVEAAVGVSSTYFLMTRSAFYNLMSPLIKEIVADLLRMGHAIGLHFDASLLTDRSSENISRQVDAERALLSSEFGVDIDAVSFHQPSQNIVNGNVRLSVVNTYNRDEIGGAEYYSDSNMKFRSGDPLEVFKKAEVQRLQFLFHPEWWTETETDVAGKWRQIIRNQTELMCHSADTREDTFDSAGDDVCPVCQSRFSGEG